MVNGYKFRKLLAEQTSWIEIFKRIYKKISFKYFWNNEEKRMYLFLNYRQIDIASVALINYVCCPYKQNAELNLSFFFNVFNVFTENLQPQYICRPLFYFCLQRANAAAFS
jgi:hypothetical protein